MNARYTFGDDDPAVRRMELVAAAYETVSRAFVGAAAPAGPGLAVDLGCGPGFSTRLLAGTLRPRQLLGLDSSAAILDIARQVVPRAHFAVHDVAVTPLPIDPPDVLYTRLVLAHLPEPAALANRWQSQLAPGGVLLIEELEAIEAPPGPLQDYDRVSEGVVIRGGGVMYAGPLLAHLGGRCTRITVDAAHAATIYRFNVVRWLADDTEPVDEAQLAALDRGLAELATRPDHAQLSWIVRQLALRAS